MLGLNDRLSISNPTRAKISRRNQLACIRGIAGNWNEASQSLYLANPLPMLKSPSFVIRDQPHSLVTTDIAFLSKSLELANEGLPP